MNYLRRDDRKSKSKKVFLTLIITTLVIIIVFIFSNNVTNFFSRSLNFLAYPIWQIKNSASVNDFYLTAFFRSRVRLAEEVKDLKEKLLKTELELKGLELAIQENQSLKEILDRADLSLFTPALVLVRPPQASYDSFIIDLGIEDGVSTGRKVFFESVLLGEIVEVFDKTSKVKLYSSSGIETQAFIERIDLAVKAKGKGGGNFAAEVPKDALVEVGDYLIVLGSSQKLLGQVEEIENEPTKSFKKLLFRYPVNLTSIKWVTVEK